MLLDRNPKWHGLIDGKMPPYPAAVVQDVLTRFGIENPAKLKAWPFGPFDIIAAFEYCNTRYLLKGRHVEQRGVKSLFQTQDIQKQLLRLGFPGIRLSGQFFRRNTGRRFLTGKMKKTSSTKYSPFYPACHSLLIRTQLS